MEIRGYINFLRRRWWLLLIGPALACITAYFVSMQITPVYRANAELLVVNQTTYQLTELNGLQVDERLTNTYVKLIERREVLHGVIERLDLQLSVEDLAKQISVSAIEETQLITVNVEDLDPDRAAAIANATAEEFVTDINQQVGSGGGAVSISEPAVAPDDPFKPNLRTNLMLAGVLGLLVAGGLAIALEYLDDTITLAAIRLSLAPPRFSTFRQTSNLKEGSQARIAANSGASPGKALTKGARKWKPRLRT